MLNFTTKVKGIFKIRFLQAYIKLYFSTLHIANPKSNKKAGLRKVRLPLFLNP